MNHFLMTHCYFEVYGFQNMDIKAKLSFRQLLFKWEINFEFTDVSHPLAK